MYSLAIDLGTTTLAASLIDCASGERRAISGALNPQRRFGADVISRTGCGRQLRAAPAGDVCPDSHGVKAAGAGAVRFNRYRLG